MDSKLVPLSEAIAELVGDGASVVMGAGLEPAIPFAATHEIIRQGKRGLTVIAPISDASTDMMIGAGAVAEVTGAWVGNVSGGLGHNYRRALEAAEPHAVKVNDHSNFSLGMALMAGAHGMPYAPTRSILGSDIVTSNPTFRMAENPFSEEREPVVLVLPLTPDIAILAVQRADAHGNCHYWGSAGLVQEAALASERIIVMADEIVDEATIASDPSRVPFPGFRVSAVCHLPAGGHPSPMTGRWRRDTDFFDTYHRRSRDREGFLEWLDEWVFGVADHAAYRKKLGRRLDDLAVKGEALSAPANYAAE